MLGMKTTGDRKRRGVDHAGHLTTRMSRHRQQVVLGLVIVALFALMIYNRRHGL